MYIIKYINLYFSKSMNEMENKGIETSNKKKRKQKKLKIKNKRDD